MLRGLFTHGTQHATFRGRPRNEHDIILAAAGSAQPLLVQHTNYGERDITNSRIPLRPGRIHRITHR